MTHALHAELAGVGRWTQALLLIAVSACAVRGEESTAAKEAVMNHPGTIRFVDVYENRVREVPAEQVPLNKRFVFLRNGVEVESASVADEVVPIVEVRMRSLNRNGELVAPEHAETIRIEEIGPAGRPLRWTQMKKD